LKRLKKILKIIFISVGVLFIGVLITAHILLKPASDEKIINELSKGVATPYITKKKYEKFVYRVVSMQRAIDTMLPTLVFVHGSPGSPLDYKRYFNDTLLNTKANLITYERIGYNQGNLGDVQGTLAAELSVLHDVINDVPSENVVLVGYSYGGPIILASEKSYKYKVSLASAVVGEYEPMFWLLNFCRWKLTKPFIPKMLKAAAKEKFAHVTDLPKYKEVWNVSPSKVLNIHGNKDFIVPYKNSEFLQKTIDKDKFIMITLEGGKHDLIWSDFSLIKKELLKIVE